MYIVVIKPGRKVSRVRPTRGRERNDKIGLNEVWREYADCSEIPQDKVRWRAWDHVSEC